MAITLILLQITPLFWKRPFYIDWINHVWMVEYYANHLTQFASFPTTIDVAQSLGNPVPVFYGVFFYPLLSLIAIFTGADAAVRILSCLLFIAPMCSFTALFGVFTKERPLAIFLAISVNSAVYSLTNLYARSALTEFFAYQLLLLSVSLIFYGISQRRAGNITISLGLACTALSLGTHPVTFYTFSLFVVPLLLLGYFPLKRIINFAQLRRALFWACCAGLTLLPWVINVVKYRADLKIATTRVLAGKLHYFPLSIDSIWGRIGFFYTDPRVLSFGMDATSTPFLDAPFSIPLIIVSATILWYLTKLEHSQRLRFVLPSILVIFTLIYAAMPPGNAATGIWPDSTFVTARSGVLHKLLVPIQFAYRLAGIFALCLTVVIIIGFARLSQTGKPGMASPGLMTAAYISALIALAGTGQKLYVTYVEFLQYPVSRTNNAPLSPPKGSDRVLLMGKQRYEEVIKNTTTYPELFYGRHDYLMPGIYARQEAQNPPGSSLELNITSWGKQPPVTCDQPCLLRTNIVPSKFHKILVNGAPPENVIVSNSTNLDIIVAAGTHTISIDKLPLLTRYVSASIWVVLFWFLASFAALIGSMVKGMFRRNIPDCPTPEKI